MFSFFLRAENGFLDHDSVAFDGGFACGNCAALKFSKVLLLNTPRSRVVITHGFADRTLEKSIKGENAAFLAGMQ